jgi:hypothetical protein
VKFDLFFLRGIQKFLNVQICSNAEDPKYPLLNPSLTRVDWNREIANWYCLRLLTSNPLTPAFDLINPIPRNTIFQVSKYIDELSFFREIE